MAIAKDATSSAHAQGASSLSWSHTCTGSDLLLLVHSGTNGTPVSTSGVTYNGVALTSRWSDSRSWTAASGWSLVAPATGANTVAITLSAAEDTEFGQAISYTGVDQTTPHGTAQVANGASTAPAVPTLTSATGEICVGFLMTSDAAITSGSGQTAEISDVNFASDSAQTDSEPGAASVDITWTTAGGPWTCGGIPIKPSSGGQTIAIGLTALNILGLVESLAVQLPIGVGSFTINGLAPSLEYNVILPITNASSNVTGFTPNLERTIAISTASLTIQGTSLGLDFSIPIGVGSVDVSGASITLLQTVEISNGSFAAQGISVSLSVATPLGVDSLTINGFAQSLQQSVILEIGTNSIVVDGSELSIATTLELSAPSTITVLGFTPNPTFAAQTISIDVGTIILSGATPEPIVSAIGVAQSAVSVSGISPSLEEQLPIGSVDVLNQGFAPSLNSSIQINVDQLLITGLGVTLQTSISSVDIGVGSAVISGYVQTLVSGYPTVDIGSRNLSITGLSPAIEQLLLIRDTMNRADNTLSSRRSDATHTSKRTST